MPSTRMKIPKITASVDRLLLGFRITMIPTTMLAAPISTASHQPHVSSRSSLAVLGVLCVIAGVLLTHPLSRVRAVAL